MSRFLAARVALVAAATISAAQAAEMTLYKQPGYGGAQLTLRGNTPEIRSVGFADQASSLVVTSGRWEVCTQPDFRGDCVTLSPGEYPILDPKLNHRIESARDVGNYANQTGSYNRYGRGAIELFGQPGFRGRTMQLQGDATSLAEGGFDDRASSVIVTEGTWQLCTDPDFSGDCRIYGPGRYADLGYGMAKQVSSARVVRATREAPAVLRGGYEANDVEDDQGTARVILYSNENFRGESMAISGRDGSLDRSGFENVAASMIIEGGQWLLCTDQFFRGNCRVMGPGRYRTLRDFGLYQAISSVRPAAADTPAPQARANPNGDIELFLEPNFGGRGFATRRDISNLGPTPYNDRVASVVVYAGQWELCSDGEYGGRCSVFAAGRYPEIGGLTNKVSSLRRIR